MVQRHGFERKGLYDERRSGRIERLSGISCVGTRRCGKNEVHESSSLGAVWFPQERGSTTERLRLTSQPSLMGRKRSLSVGSADTPTGSPLMQRLGKVLEVLGRETVGRL